MASMQSASAQDALALSAVFVQAGSASGARVLTAGLTWDWGSQRMLGPGQLSGYLEASLSQWRYERGISLGRGHLTHLGLTPVFRWRLDSGDSPWFMEAGVGLSLTSALYQTESKRFSTRFNFGTHLGVGRNFGDRREHELALRIEHFSNAGIKHPNPGENFVQIRYSFRYR